MAYKQIVFPLGDSNEYEYIYAGNYGAKGEKRADRKKASPEQIKKQNQKNKVKRIRRTIKLNFVPGDLWVCFKYPAGVRLSLEEVKRDFETFRDTLRKKYKQRGQPLKYIYRMELGERGGIHIHSVINRIRGADTDRILSDIWAKTVDRSMRRHGIRGKRTEGLVDYQSIYDSGGYEDLAKYICKTPDEDTEGYEQLSLFPTPEIKVLTAVQTSRNLIRPEDVKKEKEYHHWTMRRILMDGPKPSPGFYIDQDSIRQGINPYTGLSYLKYTEIKIKGGGSG